MRSSPNHFLPIDPLAGRLTRQEYVSELTDEWTAALASVEAFLLRTQRAPTTRANVRYIGLRFALWAGSQIPAAITDAQVVAYLEARRASGVAVSTVKTELQALRAIFRVLCGPDSPAARVALPRVPRHQPSILSDDDVHRLMVQPCDADRYFIRDRAIFSVFVFCGLRLSELTALSLDDVDLAGRRLIVRCGKGSTSGTVPLNQTVLDALSAAIATRPLSSDPALFISRFRRRVSRAGIVCIVRKYAERAGLNVHAHQLRHYFATSLVDRGVNLAVIQRALRHKRIESTMVYAHVREHTLRDALDSIAWT